MIEEMTNITHQQQQERWEKEHQKPTVLLQMDDPTVSRGVEKFLEWFKGNQVELTELRGLEMCCGKGRNVLGLAKRGADMIGLDFSVTAIKESQKRAQAAGLKDKTEFMVQDVTLPLPVTEDSLDFAIDCFGSTDIESKAGREAARDNLIKVLKPGGYLLLYLLSTDDVFHKELIKTNPGPNPGSFIHPVNGKYEKAFTEDEVKQFYGQLKLVTLERVPRKAIFFGKEYDCNHIWAVFQKL
jgi:SAM-dependent methyltransferase